MNRSTLLALTLLCTFACTSVRDTTTSTTPVAPTTTQPGTSTTESTTTTTYLPESASVRIAIIGDFGDGGDAQMEIAAAISAHRELDALLTTGDNFYSDDADAIWEGPYGWLEDRQVPVYAAWGNHDVETRAREKLVREHLGLHRNWYTADLGPVLLVVLDSNQFDHPGQRRWLETRLRIADKPVVVTFHHALYSCGAHGSNMRVQAAWLDLFREYEVTAVFNGHDHDYERFVEGSTHYIVTGGGGRHLRPFRDCPQGTPEPVSWNDSHHHYLLVDASPDRLVVTALTAEGEMLDEFDIPLDD